MSPPERPLRELDVLKLVGARLEGAGIDYMLTGSLAMNYYAQPRMTRDIDLVVALGADDARRVVALFEADFYVEADSVRHAVASSGMFNLLHLDSVVKVDVIVRKDSAYRRAEFDRRQQARFEDEDIWIVSKEDLVLSKLAWALPSHSELQLRDVRNLLASGVDRDYLSRWSDELNVTELLEACLDD